MASIDALKAFLDANPDFDFNIIEYLLSVKYKEFIGQSINVFRRSLFEDPPNNPKDKMFHAITNTNLSTHAYRNLKNISNFNDIPLINKRTLLDNPLYYINNDYEISDLFARETSGTTRKPVTIYWSEEFYFEYLISTAIKISILVDVFDNACKNAFFSITISDNPNLKERVILDPTDSVGLMLLVKIDEQKKETIDRLFQMIGKFKPALLISNPYLLEIIISHIEEKTFLNCYTPLAVITGGSALTEGVRQKVQHSFKTRVFDCYSMTEFGFIASECNKQNGMHIDRSMIIELDPNEPEEPNDRRDTGELVVSSIKNKAMPLLRFRTGDIATIDYSNCDCGRTGFRIKRIWGRRMIRPLFLYLTTKGWKSGKPHTIEIWFVEYNKKYYVISERLDRAHWVQNLIHDPRVSFTIKYDKFEGFARIVDKINELQLAADVSDLMNTKYRYKLDDGLVIELAVRGLPD